MIDIAQPLRFGQGYLDGPLQQRAKIWVVQIEKQHAGIEVPLGFQTQQPGGAADQGVARVFEAGTERLSGEVERDQLIDPGIYAGIGVDVERAARSAFVDQLPGGIDPIIRRLRQGATGREKAPPRAQFGLLQEERAGGADLDRDGKGGAKFAEEGGAEIQHLIGAKHREVPIAQALHVVLHQREQADAGPEQVGGVGARKYFGALPRRLRPLQHAREQRRTVPSERVGNRLVVHWFAR